MLKKINKIKNEAFSLVEVAIVLVVLGFFFTIVSNFMDSIVNLRQIAMNESGLNKVVELYLKDVRHQIFDLNGKASLVNTIQSIYPNQVIPVIPSSVPILDSTGNIYYVAYPVRLANFFSSDSPLTLYTGANRANGYSMCSIFMTDYRIVTSDNNEGALNGAVKVCLDERCTRFSKYIDIFAIVMTSNFAKNLLEKPKSKWEEKGNLEIPFSQNGQYRFIRNAQVSNSLGCDNPALQSSLALQPTPVVLEVWENNENFYHSNYTFTPSFDTMVDPMFDVVFMTLDFYSNSVYASYRLGKRDIYGDAEYPIGFSDRRPSTMDTKIYFSDPIQSIPPRRKFKFTALGLASGSYDFLSFNKKYPNTQKPCLDAKTTGYCVKAPLYILDQSYFIYPWTVDYSTNRTYAITYNVPYFLSPSSIRPNPPVYVDYNPGRPR